ncbi:MAG: hypothetical protein Q4F80_06035, partial [bacterium]|nr:hypothetical protein [bacterium]
ALDGETPYDNANLFGYLQKHMSVMKSATNVQELFYITAPGATHAFNSAFYTTDGMRFEFRAGGAENTGIILYESGQKVCTMGTTGQDIVNEGKCGGCGSFGLNNNTDATTKPPCLITVDVNGDRKPNPANVLCRDWECAELYKYSDPNGKKLTDLFSIMITDKEAIPYGVAAQRAMYNSRK